MAKREIKRPVTEEDIRAWEDGWSEMMITIWREKIMSLGIVDTMTLYNRLSHVVSRAEGVTAVTHEFMEYGIFMEAGTGRGYEIHGKKYNDKNGNSTTLGAIVDKGDAADLFTNFNGFYETFDEGLSWHMKQ